MTFLLSRPQDRRKTKYAETWLCKTSLLTNICPQMGTISLIKGNFRWLMARLPLIIVLNTACLSKMPSYIWTSNFKTHFKPNIIFMNNICHLNFSIRWLKTNLFLIWLLYRGWCYSSKPKIMTLAWTNRLFISGLKIWSTLQKEVSIFFKPKERILKSQASSSTLDRGF